MKPQIKQYIALFLLVVLTFSCGKNKDNGEINELIYGVVMSVDNDSRIERMDQTCEYLSREIGIKVNYVKGSDYAAVIEAMKTGKVDFASTGPFSYLIANAKTGAESLVATAYPDGKLNYYGSIIITSAKSGIESIEQVKLNPKKYSIAFADPASTSGYLYPMSYLRSIGIEPSEDLGQALFAGGHTAGIFSCISQKVDLACTTSTSLERLVEAGRIEKDSYRILWHSDIIPPTNVYIRKGLPEKYKIALKNAFVNMKDKDPELMQLIKNQYDKDIVYAEVKDSVYADMRKLINKEFGDLLK